MRKALIAAAILLIASCKAQSPTEPPIHTGSGTLRAMVLEATTNAGVPNVAIEIRRGDNGMLVTTLMTDAFGAAETSLPAGVYSVRIGAPAGYVARAETSSQFTLAAGTTASMTAILAKV